jgi:hypothetical protein
VLVAGELVGRHAEKSRPCATHGVTGHVTAM